VAEEAVILQVTDDALGALTEVLDQAEPEDGRTLRLVSEEGEYRFTLDERREGDQVVTSGDRELLVIADDVSESLDGVALEYVDSPEGGRLRLAAAS
jgi:Fe-S cluster assembly iron-binding protein IscA